MQIIIHYFLHIFYYLCFYTQKPLKMTNEEYHADTSRISKSGIELILRSPAHYYERYLNPNRAPSPTSQDLEVGTASHTMILEPHLFDRDFFLFDDLEKIREIGGTNPRATTKYKQWKAAKIAEYPNKTALPPQKYDYFRRLLDSVHSHPAARVLLSQGLAEQTVLFEDFHTGAPCKCRPDWYDIKNRLIVDLKTTDDASPAGFGKSAVKWGYDIQAPFYFDGLASAGMAVDGLVYIAVEKNPPYAVAVYFAERDVMQLGREKYLQGLETYMECKRTGEWHGYSQDIQPLKLPKWAFRKA
jgi:hypothetical protein